MTVFDDLLVVQEHDTKLDQLRHRRQTLPQRQRLTELATQVGDLRRQIDEVSTGRDELVREQKLREDEVASLGEKRQAAEVSLYSGAVSNPRELQALQEEIDALGRRVSHLEDRTLELMEAIEPLDSRLVALTAEVATAEAAIEQAEIEITAAEAEIDAEVESEQEARTTQLAAVSPDLLAEYEQLRSQSGGIAIARLVGSQCGGCHLGLSAVEMARIRKLPADAAVHCEECGRLLAR